MHEFRLHCARGLQNIIKIPRNINGGGEPAFFKDKCLVSIRASLVGLPRALLVVGLEYGKRKASKQHNSSVSF